METLEGNSGRKEMKRKSEEVSKKKSKRMKFERLEGWGESEIGTTSQLELPEGWIVEEKKAEPRKLILQNIGSFEKLFEMKKAGKEKVTTIKKEVRRKR